MLKEKRHKQIIDIIQQKGSVQTAELGKIFQTTRQTIHNDLDVLSQEGKLKKVYGGAVRISKSDEPPIATRRVQNRTDKNIIGSVAAEFVNEKDTIFLDVSTTVNAMIPYLKDFNQLTIITNSIEVAYLLGRQPQFEVVMIGGQVRAQDLACGGNQAVETLKDIYVDKSFFGTGGVSINAGFTDYHFTDSQIRKVMIKNALQSFVLFDASKIEAITISKFADFDDIDKLISYQIKNQAFLDFVSKEQIDFIDAKDYVAADGCSNACTD